MIYGPCPGEVDKFVLDPNLNPNVLNLNPNLNLNLNLLSRNSFYMLLVYSMLRKSEKRWILAPNPVSSMISPPLRGVGAPNLNLISLLRTD